MHILLLLTHDSVRTSERTIVKENASHQGVQGHMKFMHGIGCLLTCIETHLTTRKHNHPKLQKQPQGNGRLQKLNKNGWLTS